MARGDLTDAQYERLRPLLPSSDGKRGHPYEDHRKVINGILWRLRTGAPWRDMPERYGPWQTCYDRLVNWRRAGVWERILQTLQGQADEVGAVDWEVVSVDSTVVRAHQHAAGARHASAKAEAEATKKGELPSERRRSAGTQSRRLHDQAAPRFRRAGAPPVDHSDGRATPRQHATGEHSRWHPRPAPTGPAAEAAGPGDWGQGLQLSQVSPGSATAGDPPRHPGAQGSAGAAAKERTGRRARAAVRQGGVSAAQLGRARGQSPEAMASDRDTV